MRREGQCKYMEIKVHVFRELQMHAHRDIHIGVIRLNTLL